MSSRIGRPRVVMAVLGVSGIAILAGVLALHPKGDAELSDEAKLLAANARDPQVAASLVAIALDPRQSASTRYVALRRLETQVPGRAVEVAEKLATAPDELIRCNAVAVLVRSHEPGAPAALERARRASPANEALATQLASAERKRGN